MLKKLLPLLIVFVFLKTLLIAQDAVTEDRVKFNTLSDHWVQMEIELTCNGNLAPDAVNPDFVENITMAH